MKLKKKKNLVFINAFYPKMHNCQGNENEHFRIILNGLLTALLK